MDASRVGVHFGRGGIGIAPADRMAASIHASRDGVSIMRHRPLRWYKQTDDFQSASDRG